ncbi:MAG: SpoIIE family protein phosphatase [Bacteroidota bacterium]|nr:SpoIIE family protein phosphatase [Bacteroidota bacterium]
MGKRFLVLAILFCLQATSILIAQPNRNGVPIVTNYPHAITLGSEQNWCITQDSRGIIYVGNNDKGVLEYDGVEWRRIRIPKDPMVLSMVSDEDGVVYVGADSEFGFLAPDLVGDLQYRSISDTLDPDLYSFSGVRRTYHHQGKVYFCSFEYIFVFDTSGKQLSVLQTSEHSLYSFLVDGTLYLSDFEKGLLKYQDGQFTELPGGKEFNNLTITGLVKYDSSRLLVGTFFFGLYLYNPETGLVEREFADPDLDEFLADANITSIRSLQEDFVVSTFNSGVVILTREGQAREIIGENEGLIDEQVPSVFYNDQMEGSSPLWIPNFMGISKLEPANPFRVFTEMSGFEGFITDVKSFNGRLFISTFEGLYYKNSSSTGTEFIRVPVIGAEIIRQLFLFRPTAYRSFLLASTENGIFVVDQQMRVTRMENLISNPPEAEPRSKWEYSGWFLLQDPEHQNRLFAGESQVVGLRYSRGRWEEFMRVDKLPENVMLQKKCIDKYGYFWGSSEFTVARIDIEHPAQATLKLMDPSHGLPSEVNNQVYLDPETEEVLLGTRNGFYRYNYFRDSFYRDTFYNNILPAGENLIMAFHRDLEGDFWFSFENSSGAWTELVARKVDGELRIIQEKAFQRLENTSVDVFYSAPEGGIWFGKSNRLYQFDKEFSRRDTMEFQALIRRVTLESDSVIFNGSIRMNDSQDKGSTPQIRYSLNHIRFNWAAPFFEQEDEVEYSYQLRGFEELWSPWSKIPFQEFTNLKYGSYTMVLKARNVYGNESLPATWSFTILRPWYAHFLAYIAYILLAALLVYILIKLYTRRLKQENIRLESIIAERTAEIRRQKEELTDSIEYASRIQQALLPSLKLLDTHQVEHFVLFKPRDIVSGDFYWVGAIRNKLLVVAADCTGHGVPGAFMSMLGMTFLDEIVIKSERTDTSEIMGQLREHVITSLKQSGQNSMESTKDGMDLAMVSIDLKSKKFQYSGAYNSLYLVRKLKRGEKAKLNKGLELELPRGAMHDDRHLLLQIRPDQMPIGISEKELPFQAPVFKDEGYNIYMFSDGYVDQFGGPAGKKYMSKNFKKLILELQSVPLKDQAAAMEKTLSEWMGNLSQVDDILVMGLRIN